MERETWLALLASVGVGCATYYQMTRQGQGIGQTVQQMMPMISGMNGKQQTAGQKMTPTS